MGPKAKNQGELDQASSTRQLGLALALDVTERRELVPTAPAALAVREPVAVEEAPRVPRVFVVSELVRAARLTLESRFAEVRVEGEISGFKRSGPGHLYFCLKDSDASIDCVMYSREASRLKFQLSDGMAVRLRGRLTIYEGRGRFQMSVLDIEPTGAGALGLAFEQLKQKLQAEGLFAQERKRRLPFLPRRIGVVTSPQGAVIRDIIRVAHRRFPAAILLAPVPVQGPGAAQGIAMGLARLARVPDVDVIIVARGGGSMEDLWAFNDEALARAIVACRVPVISAVGHETDFTIADFVADVRASTPSAAAELAVPMVTELRADLSVLSRRAARGATAHIRQQRLVIERARARLGDPRRIVDDRRQRVDDLAARAHRATARRLARLRSELAASEVTLSRAHPHRRIAAQKTALGRLAQQLEAAARRALSRRREPLRAIEHKLDALSPRRVLDRGYSLTFGPDGHLLTDASAVAPGARLRISLQAGELAATVTDTTKANAPVVGEKTEDKG
jgi:exodeoxyribonuclease VII large subunit